MIKKSTYDNDLLVVLKGKINAGKIRTNEDYGTYVLDLEANFAIGFNRIDWQKNGYIFVMRLGHHDASRQPKIDAFLGKVSE